jgi:uncharacterized protein (DUF4415 family)
MKAPYPRELTNSELAAMKDEDIDFSDIPELDEEFWNNAKIVETEGTTSVTLRVKTPVLNAFKASGKGYQTRMNAVLESYIRSMKKNG